MATVTGRGRDGFLKCLGDNTRETECMTKEKGFAYSKAWTEE